MISKKIMMSVALALILSAVLVGCLSANDTSESDASTFSYDRETTVYSNRVTEFDFFDDDKDYKVTLGGYNVLPTGISLLNYNSNDGTFDTSLIINAPETGSNYTITFSLMFTYREGLDSNTNIVDFTIYVVPSTVIYEVTYNAGIGTVNGSGTYTESITDGCNASLPTATYSSGAYTFLGWATSSTSSTTVSSYTVTSSITLYAVWSQNTVDISSYTATVSSGQSFSNIFSTYPSGASLSVYSYGGLSGYISLSGKTLYGTLTDVSAGTYTVILKATYTGYISGYEYVTIYVPVVIEEPITYTLTSGETFSYEPVTDPTNATITLTSVTLDGNMISNSGLSVSGRTITGILSSSGTYKVTYTATATGYITTSDSVYIYVSEAPASSDTASITGITATARAGSPRSYDFIATGVSNATNYVWDADGSVFSSSSSTSLYQFDTSGIHTVTCTVSGSDGSTDSVSVTVVCTETYYRDCAWSGYGYNYTAEVDSTPTVTLSGDWLSYTVSAVDGIDYLVISGTPDSEDVGSEFTVNIDGSTYTITVYEGQSEAPVSDFTYEVDDETFTVTVTFTGSNASFVLWDYTGSGDYVTDTTHTYSEAGQYTISCKAVNNISERSSTNTVEVFVVEEITLSLDELTDFSINVGERLNIILDTDTDAYTVELIGTASDFCTLSESTITVEPDTAGEYDLTVIYDSVDPATDDISKTIKVTVTDEDPEPVQGTDWSKMILYGVIILLLLYIGKMVLSSHNGGRRRGGYYR